MYWSLTSSEETVRMASCLERFIDNGDPESHRLYRVRRTLLQMLDDRGFFVDDTDREMPLEEFRARFGNNPPREALRIVTHKRSSHNYKVVVSFSHRFGKETLGVKDLGFFLQSVMSEGIRHAILIVPEKVTPQARKAIKELSPDFTLEMFEEIDLLMNITKHVLVPEHVILTEAEKNELLKKYSVQEHQLPRMLESDPLARYYGLKRGKIIKLIYDIDGKQITYRCIW